MDAELRTREFWLSRSGTELDIAWRGWGCVWHHHIRAASDLRESLRQSREFGCAECSDGRVLTCTVLWPCPRRRISSSFTMEKESKKRGHEEPAKVKCRCPKSQECHCKAGEQDYSPSQEFDSESTGRPPARKKPKVGDPRDMKEDLAKLKSTPVIGSFSISFVFFQRKTRLCLRSRRRATTS